MKSQTALTKNYSFSTIATKVNKWFFVPSTKSGITGRVAISFVMIAILSHTGSKSPVVVSTPKSPVVVSTPQSPVVIPTPQRITNFDEYVKSVQHHTGGILAIQELGFILKNSDQAIAAHDEICKLSKLESTSSLKAVVSDGLYKGYLKNGSEKDHEMTDKMANGLVDGTIAFGCDRSPDDQSVREDRN